MAALAAGFALRVWVLTSPVSALEADEAVVGLMAIRALDGDLSVFYWGALYGGSLEALLVTAVFAVTGPSVLVLKLVALALYAVAVVLVWLVGRRTVGEPSARLGAALLWVWPAFFVWWSTKERAYFAAGLVLGLLALLLVLRLRERDSRSDAALLGLVLGLGVWATLQAFLLALPALAWLAWRRPWAFRLAPYAIPGALAGAAPWLAWNVRHGWNAVLPSSVAGAQTTYLERLGDLVTTVLPMWLGVRALYSHDWLFSKPVGLAVVGAALAGFVAVLVRRPARLEPLLAIGVAFPFLYAATSFTFFVEEPRYLVFVGPVIALLLGAALARGGVLVAGAGLAAAAVVSVVGLAALERQGLYAPLAPDVRVPADLDPVVRTLEANGVDRVIANYWIAYRLTLETEERIVATSSGHWRYRPYRDDVLAEERPGWVFVRGARPERQMRGTLLARGYSRLPADGFVVYVPRGA